MMCDDNKDYESHIEADEHFIRYRLKAEVGNSGGPVFKKGNDNKYYIVGVHIKEIFTKNG